MNENRVYNRGDVYLIDFEPHIGSEQGGIRPAVVLQNNIGNIYCPTLIVAPITSRSFKKSCLPTHYIIKDSKNVGCFGIVLLEQIKTIDKCRVYKYLGSFSDKEMIEIEKTINISLDLNAEKNLNIYKNSLSSRVLWQKK